MAAVTDQETVQQVAAIEGMNKELADTQAERDAALAHPRRGHQRARAGPPARGKMCGVIA